MDALATSSAAVGQVIFGREGLTENALAMLRVDRTEWRNMTVRSLLEANRLSTDLTTLDWQNAAGAILVSASEKFCAAHGCRRFNSLTNRAASDSARSMNC
jgi:hypothetical protein